LDLTILMRTFNSWNFVKRTIVAVSTPSLFWLSESLNRHEMNNRLNARTRFLRKDGKVHLKKNKKRWGKDSQKSSQYGHEPQS